jgi:primary-amine oxidase
VLRELVLPERRDAAGRRFCIVRAEPVRAEGPVEPAPHGGALQVANPHAPLGPLSQVPAYQLLPGDGALSVLDRDDGPQARAAFSAERVWLTAYKATERYPVGDYVNQSAGGDGLPAYTADGDPVVDTDLVLWVTVGFHHLTRTEDWPILPTRWHGFAIRPFNFFAHSPAASPGPRTAP